jgi:phospholipid transport system substrate-binding protein
MTRLHNNLSRRTFGAGFIAATATTLVPTSVLALTEASAKTLVDSIVGKINTVISSGKSEAAMLREFESIFVRYADVPTIARYALGADARSLSGSEMSAFTKAFQGYISRKYGRRFREFIGGKIEVNGSKKVKSFYEVKTTAYLRGSSPFAVTFLVSDRSGKDLFFNMFIEGINLLLTERTEIGAMLDRRKGNIQALINDLKTA